MVPKYALFREYPPTLTRTELDGMVLASGAALESYIYRGESHPRSEPHGISWVRSYWQKGGTWGMCVFEAPNLSVLAAFQDLCATPFSDAMEVVEAVSNPDASTPVAVTVSLPPVEVPDPINATSIATGERRPQIGRVYWSPERQIAVSLVVDEPRRRSDLRVESGLIEIRPEDYQ